MVDCAKGLITSSFNVEQFWKNDRRLSILVDRDVYDTAKSSMGVEAILYGVPLGANFDQYRSMAESLRSRYSETVTRQSAFSYQWSGLDAAVLNAYRDCLSFNRGQGLTLSAGSATENDIELIVRWVRGLGPAIVDVIWQGPDEIIKNLPSKVGDAGDVPHAIPRPQDEEVLLVAQVVTNEGGHVVPMLGASLTIGPVYKPPVPKVELAVRRFTKTGRDHVRTDIGFEMMERDLTLKFVGIAQTFGPTGKMGYRVLIDDNEVDGRAMSDVGHGRQTYRRETTIPIPLGASSIELIVDNHFAQSESVECEFWY